MEGNRHNYCKLAGYRCNVCKVSGGKTKCGYWKDRGLTANMTNVDNLIRCPKV